ncbi:hypothetical protein E4U21_006789 [Claviceps maximensis]|nr:hypothetical protein E4U21_006789 [Claviceps maximensis]
MAVAPSFQILRNVFPFSRACVNRILSPQYSQRLVHSKGSPSGEEGQFKAVTASQSSHEPRFVPLLPLYLSNATHAAVAVASSSSSSSLSSAVARWAVAVVQTLYANKLQKPGNVLEAAPQSGEP